MDRTRDKQLTVWLDKVIHERLKALAKSEGRAVSELIREAIVNLLKKREVKKTR